MNQEHQTLAERRLSLLEEMKELQAMSEADKRHYTDKR